MHIIKRFLPLVLISLFLLGAGDCEPAPPPEPEDDGSYCKGATEGDVLDGLAESLGLQVQELNTIIGGDLSVDRRSTVYVEIIGHGYCTGVVLTPHTVITAAHCNGDRGHNLYLARNDGNPIPVTNAIEHPEWWKWGSQNDFEARKADLMILHTSVPLPGPFPTALYDSNFSRFCTGLTAQGWGKDEFPNEAPILRESAYRVTLEEEKVIRTKQATWGGICFGDSGGPLYANLPGGPQLAGITSTTASSDCLVASTHIKVAYYKQWIEANTKP